MFKVTEDIIYVGVNDHEVDLFEGQYDVPNGMAYNSYVVLDEKVAVFDTVDAHFKDEWLANLEEAFAGRTPDYLIVQHMEPDHAANIANFAEKYPEANISPVDYDPGASEANQTNRIKLLMTVAKDNLKIKQKEKKMAEKENKNTTKV